MKPTRLITLAFVSFWLLFVLSRPVEAKDSWIQVRSKNFLLVGNASEKDIRKVGTRLEQFRETFRQVFGSMKLTSPIPTNVVVFRSDSAYKNFKPKRADGKIDTGVAGYFQPGEDVNYITLSTEGEDADTFGTIFHEYVHFIIDTNFGKSDVPAWFNEGLAEYYQTFAIVDDQKVKLGLPQSGHLRLLQQSSLMPLGKLFGISNRQLGESGSHSRSIFYAQSWALIHYILQSGKTDGLGKYLNALSSGIEQDKAFQDAFATNYDKMETDLRKYVSQSRYNYNELTFKTKLVFDAAMTVEPLNEAQSNAYLGDLLYHTNRIDDAEPFLLASLKLQNDLSMANTALGMVKIRQRKFDEAKTYLEKAIASDQKNHIAFYRYAFMLSREGRDEFGFVRSIDAAAAAKMREALKKAIAINPGFTESYELFAFVSLVNGEGYDEAVEMLKTALKYQPGNQKYLLRVAEILSRQNKINEADEIAAKLMRTSDDEEIRARAQNLLDYVAKRREYDKRQAEYNQRAEGEGSGGRRSPPKLIKSEKPITEAEIAKRQADANLRSINQALRHSVEGETRVIGHVQKIDCKTRPIVFAIKTPTEAFMLTSKDFQGLALNAFEPAASRVAVGCDENISVFRAVITYRPTANAKAATRGELIAIEFVPSDFRIMTDEEMGSDFYVVYDEEPPAGNNGGKPPDAAPNSTDEDALRRDAMMQAVRRSLRKPAPGEKREMGFLERIECTKRGNYLHVRTETQTLRLFNSSPQSLAITLFTSDLEGIEFGCTLKPVEFPAIVIYTDKPDPKSKASGEIISLEFVPKSFVLNGE